MSQIFHRHTNIYTRLSILAVAVFAAMLGGAVGLLNLSGYNTNQDDFIEQPVQFSHAHHVGGIGIEVEHARDGQAGLVVVFHPQAEGFEAALQQDAAVFVDGDTQVCRAFFYIVETHRD